MTDTIYLRMRHRVEAKPGTTLKLSEAAQIIAPDKLLSIIQNISVYQFEESNNKLAILDVMVVIGEVMKHFPHADIQTIGPTQTIIEMVKEKKKISLPLFIVVWLLLIHRLCPSNYEFS